MSSMILFISSLSLIDIYSILEINENVINTVMAWTAIICFVTGMQHYFVCSFSCLFITAPIEYSSIVNSIASILFLTMSMLEAYLFGIIADTATYNDKRYQWSIFMMICIVAMGLIVAVTVHIMDVLNDGPLH
eukprot:UN08724